MSDVMESGLLSLEGYVNPAARLVFDVGAKLGQNVIDVFEIDIRAHGMSKERMQNFTMMVVHVLPRLVTISGERTYDARQCCP